MLQVEERAMQNPGWESLPPSRRGGSACDHVGGWGAIWAAGLGDGKESSNRALPFCLGVDYFLKICCEAFGSLTRKGTPSYINNLVLSGEQTVGWEHKRCGGPTDGPGERWGWRPGG